MKNTNIEPGEGRILLEFDLDQKDSMVFGTLKLYLPNKADVNENMREGYPTVATVLHGGETELQKGDTIVLEHTCLENTGQWVEHIGSHVITSIPIDSDITIYGKLDENGDVVPLFNNYVCKRIEECERSSIIITPDVYKKVQSNKGNVIAVPPNNDIELGSTVIYYKYSDYELVYFVNGVERKVIMVKRADIVAIEK